MSTTATTQVHRIYIVAADDGPGIMAEGPRTLTYEIKELDEGYCSLTITHELDDAPLTLALVSGANEEAGDGGGGGWAWVLSDLKSLLEPGTTLAGR